MQTNFLQSILVERAPSTRSTIRSSRSGGMDWTGSMQDKIAAQGSLFAEPFSPLSVSSIRPIHIKARFSKLCNLTSGQSFRRKGSMMTEATPTGPINLGFLTVFQDGPGYLGGYLVTNTWGRPLEFRLSTAVQPNRIQHILYGSTLQEYLCADLIGKTLIDKCSTVAQVLFTDSLTVLPIRSRLQIPVAAVIRQDDPAATFLPEERIARIHDKRAAGQLLFDARYIADSETLRELLEKIDPSMDLGEPFARIREAMAEARKMGVTSRAA
jgi:hypothetical protein